MSLLTCLAVHCFAQSSVIEGRITADSGEPLVGASVWLDQTRYATATDSEGFYHLSVPDGTYTLKVTYVGFQSFSGEVTPGKDSRRDVSLQESVIKGEEVMVYATRANEKTPTTFTNISSKEIESKNTGRDLPYILQYTPSVVVTSDAGNGVGYTGIRIRGSDPTRVNVTINGVPLNDSESSGTYWVDLPDFASSTNNIQIQRGVGTSTNGAGAFGATMNMQTDMPAQEPYAQINNSYGSFNTWKHTVELNTGLINGHWAFQGRLSSIASDGYIDRASASLKSYYMSGGYYGKNTTVKALMFSGKEVTYQAWYGTPEARLKNDVEGMEEVIANNGYTAEQAENLLNSGRTYNYYLYKNEVDDYVQDHYQLHISHSFSQYLNVNAAFHYTAGRGYYEQYETDQNFSDYGLPDVTVNNDTIGSTDLIRRLWLNNRFYGMVFSANYSRNKWDITFGGGLNRYDGDHYGDVIWAQYASTSDIGYRYYTNNGLKTDFNSYLKANYQLTARLNLFADMQIRTVDYKITGVDDDDITEVLNTGNNYVFFNPKFGATYALSEGESLYASYAVGNREPVRTDFVDAPNGKFPRHETLHDMEVGYRKTTSRFMYSANYYLMQYHNQLVLTGALNAVGNSLRVNTPHSYRMGIELVGGVKIASAWDLSANVTFSQNKIRHFSEVVYDYGTNWDEYNEVTNRYKNSNISFSPGVIASAQLSYQPIQPLRITLMGKYVGRQYLDNTSHRSRSINDYLLNDLKVDYNLGVKWAKQVMISFQVNNLMNVEYSSNGYTFGYRAGDYVVQENYYYPQAGRNFLTALALKF